MNPRAFLSALFALLSLPSLALADSGRFCVQTFNVYGPAYASGVAYRLSRLAEEIVKDVMRILNRKEEVISVALEEVDAKDWTDRVYIPDIQGKWNTLYKKPECNPFDK